MTISTKDVRANPAIGIAGPFLLAAAGLLAVAGPAHAASVLTEGFLASVRSDVDYLDRSSRMALDHSGNRRIRAFARSEMLEQTLTASVTGQPAKIDVQVPVAIVPAESRLPDRQDDLDRLSVLQGPAFDDLYRATHRGALRQLKALYAGYIQNGDETDLRAIATHDLPKIIRRLAELGRP